MKKRACILISLILFYLAIQYYVALQVQRVITAATASTAKIKIGSSGIYTDVRFQQGDTSLTGKVYLSWHLMTINGFGHWAFGAQTIDFELMLDQFWSLQSAVTWADLQSRLANRIKNNAAIGKVLLKTDHLNLGPYYLNQMELELSFRHGLEILLFKLEKLNYQELNAEMAIDGFEFKAQLPILQAYLNQQLPEEMVGHFDFSVDRSDIKVQEKSALHLEGLVYKMDIENKAGSATFSTSANHAQVHVIDADLALNVFKNMLGLDKSLIGQVIKSRVFSNLQFWQQEGAHQSNVLMNYSMNVPSPLPVLADCLSKDCRGKVSFQQKRKYLQKGIDSAITADLEFHDGVDFKVTFNRSFLNPAERKAFLNIQKQQFQHSFHRYMDNGGRFSALLQLMPDSVTDLAHGFIEVDSGAFTLAIEDRKTLESDFKECIISQGVLCEKLAKNIDISMHFSWIEGGRFLIKIMQGHEIRLQLMGEEGFKIKPVIKSILKKINYDITPDLLDQLILHNEIDLVFQGHGNWLINGKLLDKLDLNPSAKQYDFLEQ